MPKTTISPEYQYDVINNDTYLGLGNIDECHMKALNSLKLENRNSFLDFVKENANILELGNSYAASSSKGLQCSENVPKCPVPKLVIDNYLFAKANTDLPSSAMSKVQLIDYINSNFLNLKESLLSDDNLLSNNSPNFDSQQEGIPSLGKRGRFYGDIWDEESFLIKSNQINIIDPLDDWSSMFEHYSESHDGNYRDWHVFSTPSYKSKKNKNNTSATEDQFVPIIPPPVPVCLQHPASWGIRSRTICSDNSSSHSNSINLSELFQKIHPACYSNTVVDPPTKQANIDSISSEEDCDGIYKVWEETVQVLKLLETKNYVALTNLTKYSTIYSKFYTLKRERQRLQNILNQMYQANEPKTSSRLTYLNPFLINKIIDDADLIKNGGSSLINLYNSNTKKKKRKLDSLSAPEDSVNKKSKARQNKSLLEASKKRWKLLGACAFKHMSHADFIQKIKVHDIIEVLFDDSVWSLVQVSRLRRDGVVLRHIKVKPLNGFIGDSKWIAVEDGVIAPKGTNIDSFNIEKIMSATTVSNGEKTLTSDSDVVNTLIGNRDSGLTASEYTKVNENIENNRKVAITTNNSVDIVDVNDLTRNQSMEENIVSTASLDGGFVIAKNVYEQVENSLALNLHTTNVEESPPIQRERIKSGTSLPCIKDSSSLSKAVLKINCDELVKHLEFKPGIKPNATKKSSNSAISGSFSTMQLDKKIPCSSNFGLVFMNDKSKLFSDVYENESEKNSHIVNNGKNGVNLESNSAALHISNISNMFPSQQLSLSTQNLNSMFFQQKSLNHHGNGQSYIYNHTNKSANNSMQQNLINNSINPTMLNLQNNVVDTKELPNNYLNRAPISATDNFHTFDLNSKLNNAELVKKTNKRFKPQPQNNSKVNGEIDVNSNSNCLQSVNSGSIDDPLPVSNSITDKANAAHNVIISDNCDTELFETGTNEMVNGQEAAISFVDLHESNLIGNSKNEVNTNSISNSIDSVNVANLIDKKVQKIIANPISINADRNALSAVIPKVEAVNGIKVNGVSTKKIRRNTANIEKKLAATLDKHLSEHAQKISGIASQSMSASSIEVPLFSQKGYLNKASGDVIDAKLKKHKENLLTEAKPFKQVENLQPVDLTSSASILQLQQPHPNVQQHLHQLPNSSNLRKPAVQQLISSTSVSNYDFLSMNPPSLQTLQGCGFDISEQFYEKFLQYRKEKLLSVSNSSLDNDISINGSTVGNQEYQLNNQNFQIGSVTSTSQFSNMNTILENYPTSSIQSSHQLIDLPDHLARRRMNAILLSNQAKEVSRRIQLFKEQGLNIQKPSQSHVLSMNHTSSFEINQHQPTFDQNHINTNQNRQSSQSQVKTHFVYQPSSIQYSPRIHQVQPSGQLHISHNFPSGNRFKQPVQSSQPNATEYHNTSIPFIHSQDFLNGQRESIDISKTTNLPNKVNSQHEIVAFSNNINSQSSNGSKNL